MIRHEQTGLLVAPGDPGLLAEAMTRLVVDRELLARLSAGGYTAVRRDFTVARTVDGILAVYDCINAARRLGLSKLAPSRENT